MKKFFLLMILLFSAKSFSQQVPYGEYKIEVSGYGYHSHNATCEKHMFLEVFFSDNSSSLRIIDIYDFPQG